MGSETSLTGVALSGDVEVVRRVLREPLEPVEQEHVSVFGCMFVSESWRVIKNQEIDFSSQFYLRVGYMNLLVILSPSCVRSELVFV
jgi:hypothetical protein